MHSSVRFHFFKIQSYYSLFLQFLTFTSHLPTHEKCTPVRFWFTVYSRSAGFIRALFARLRVFSVNHAKSAYFQRKSRNVSVFSAQIQECQHIRIKFYAFILQNHTSLCISALYTSHQTFLCYSYYKEAEYYINHSIHRHKAKPYGQSVQILHLHNPIRLINLFRSIRTYFGLYILPHFSPI